VPQFQADIGIQTLCRSGHDPALYRKKFTGSADEKEITFARTGNNSAAIGAWAIILPPTRADRPFRLTNRIP
jgi:hypothetical protein